MNTTRRTPVTRSRLTLALLLGALAVPAAADGHVTVQPATAPAGGFVRLDLRVPNERDDAGTTKVDVKLPPGFLSASYEPVPGWSVKVTRERLAKPVKVEGFDVTEQVSRITWTGTGKQGVIGPGQFQDFGLSLAMPKGKPGSKLTVKALQTYQGGEVVRWIGPEDSDEPAPTVTLTAAGEGGAHGAPAEGAGGSEPSEAPAAASDDGGSDGLAIAALVVGGLGLLAGVGGLLAARRARSTNTA
jgi:uncharacterized protein YcnI